MRNNIAEATPESPLIRKHRKDSTAVKPKGIGECVLSAEDVRKERKLLSLHASCCQGVKDDLVNECSCATSLLLEARVKESYS